MKEKILITGDTDYIASYVTILPLIPKRRNCYCRLVQLSTRISKNDLRMYY